MHSIGISAEISTYQPLDIIRWHQFERNFILEASLWTLYCSHLSEVSKQIIFTSVGVSGCFFWPRDCCVTAQIFITLSHSGRNVQIY